MFAIGKRSFISRAYKEKALQINDSQSLIEYSKRDLNPHSRNGQRILSPSCLPFHHPGSLACIEDRKVPQSYVFLRNSAIISILFAFVVFLGIPCPRLARQGRTLLRISHTQTSQRVSQLRSLFAFSTLLVSRLPLNPQPSTIDPQPQTATGECLPLCRRAAAF